MTMSLISTVNHRRRKERNIDNSLYFAMKLFLQIQILMLLLNSTTVCTIMSDSTDDFTIPPQVMDPNELFIQISHTITVQSNGFNKATETRRSDYCSGKCDNE